MTIKSGGQSFQESATTEIWYEKPSDKNPYIADKSYLHGYDLLDLVQHRSFVDVLFLMFKGELPTPEQAKILETLMIACVSPGPRHPSVRAAMNAGVSKANHEHILPIGLMALGGEYNGAAEVEKAIQFLQKNNSLAPDQIASALFQKAKPIQGDWHIAPGFGTYYGDVNQMAQELASVLEELPEMGSHFSWGVKFVAFIEDKKLGWLHTGVVAAILADLGIGAREGAGLYQIMSSPGILAHGLEQTHKPIFAMPLLEDEDYVVQTGK